MKNLIQYETYNRQEVHDIFDSNSVFKAGTGTWGLQGIIKIPKRVKDYVFFVSFGQSQSGYTFTEEITEDGILTWQSQPKQTLNHPQIIDFINHNYLTSNIYLFLRSTRLSPVTKKAQPFTYLGKLAYITHDIDREQPVFFKWQIIDWNIEKARKSLENIKFVEINNVTERDSSSHNQLFQTEVPDKRNSIGSNTREFIGKKVNFVEASTKNIALGYKGESLVIEYEKQYLIDQGRPDLAARVIHKAVVEGDGAGYDVLSFDINGLEKFIEVKTTTGSKGTPFFMSLNEIVFSKMYSQNYFLYRLFNYSNITNSAEFFIINGDVSQQRELVATQFKVY